MPVCSKCREEKEFDEFSKNKSKKSGINTYCIPCMRLYYRENKERHRKINKEYCIKNREALNQKYYERLRTNVQANLAHTLRSRFNRAVRNDSKRGSAVGNLGCSIQEFKLYLEAKFEDGMNWDNKGMYGWHIDHIIPLDAFDLTDIEQVKKACHYTNLQPLWAKDNWKKRNKIINYEK